MINHKPQLDALRAFAVLTVIIYHFWRDLFGLGPQGVRLFFVLSGFLITSILLDCKSQIQNEPTRGSRVFVLRQFYVRRMLRIFPVYYAVLLLLAFVPSANLGESVWFHASYTSNFWFALKGHWGNSPMAPFWSLAVEEQFYLFWPLLVLWLPKKHIWSVAIIFAISGPAFRATMLAYGANDVMISLLTPASFDAIGLGALVALARKIPLAQSVIRLLGVASFIALISLSFTLRFAILHYAIWMKYLLQEPLWALVFAALVSKTGAGGFTRLVGMLLNLAPLRYLGRISYGVYLYHVPVFLIVGIILDKLGLPKIEPGPMCLIVGGGVAVAISSLSWHFFEEPINRLKRFFPYQASRPTLVPSGAVAAVTI